MIAVAVRGLVTRDLQRYFRQRTRLIGGLLRPLLWVFLVGAGFESVAQTAGGESYQALAYPGGIAMAALFGGMLTTIGSVYDREFGMLRLQLASPAGVSAILIGRAISATVIGTMQASVVLALAPLVLPFDPLRYLVALAAVMASSAASAAMGLLVASRLRSVESFGGVINVVLFPLTFASGALYPVQGMPGAMAVVAAANPVTAMADLIRHALGRPTEFGVGEDLLLLAVITVVCLSLAALGFDPERRLLAPTTEKRPVAPPVERRAHARLPTHGAD